EMAEYKRIGRARRLIVAGCLVERYRGDIQKSMPEVDALIGVNELSRIVSICEGLPEEPNPVEPYLYHDLTPRVLATPKHFAYINKVTQKLLDTIAEHPSLVKYIDMPLQHASAPVLKRMKRGASGDIFLRLIERVRRTIPGVAIRTSMIVGFPGETAEDFETL